MKLLGVIALLLVVLIVFVALLVVLYKNYNGRLTAINEKLEGAKNEFDDKYKDKFELIKKFITQIESKYKVESKSFEDVKGITEETLFDSESDKVLAKCYKELGWQLLTDHIIKLLNQKEEPVVFILWGNFARSKKKYITNNKHLVIESAHPSPLSAYNGFFGSKPFSKANNFLKENKIKEVDFTLLNH